MKILVACEESQAVTIELRKLGHYAFSCDTERCSGGYPQWHIQQDVLPLINGNCFFTTGNGEAFGIEGTWDMIIAFPPCTHLAVSGAAWFKEKRQDGRQQQGVDFFMKFVNCNCPNVAIENPIGIMSTYYRKPDQVIRPWQFGHAEQKSTCLWLKNLPKLATTNDVKEEMLLLPKNKRERLHYLPPGLERAKLRSKTFPELPPLWLLNGRVNVYDKLPHRLPHTLRRLSNILPHINRTRSRETRQIRKATGRAHVTGYTYQRHFKGEEEKTSNL